jgi:hypothetical protein
MASYPDCRNSAAGASLQRNVVARDDAALETAITPAGRGAAPPRGGRLSGVATAATAPGRADGSSATRMGGRDADACGSDVRR